MLVRYWQPWREIDTLRRQFDQLFDSVDTAPWTPAIELKDTGNEFVLRAQLPGIDAKDLDVQVTKDAISLSGEHHQENRSEENGFFRSEFRYGKFQRVIPLPVEVQNDQVKAEFKDGILSLTLPKVEQAKVVKLNLTQSTGTLEAGAEEA
ncbi:Hsp20/alpha crystallin family protein [Leptolyngbya sp. NIES-2104]|uniref:Hsp20/alpha crystallin family protein n=1 Tax=Leptolyngbya sp. NIES-2104 TaxID=1552121 RepID=UPI0006ECCA9B|nr:Hsp20/alpha crystallin family protein [Leptolyngbya sp. NIES-2104]GAP96758.1 small heat shock protein [Leptolyngbya sp. NIES-2104]